MNSIAKQSEITISKGLAFNLKDVTERYANTFGLSPEDAKIHEEECKRYLLLCALHPDKKLGMKGVVDNYWHTFLLFTREYLSFCNEIGSSFIHHVPKVKKDRNKKDGDFLTTMDLYRRTFSLEPSPKAWFYPRDKFGSYADCSDCSDGPNEGDCSPGKDCNGEDSSGSGY